MQDFFVTNNPEICYYTHFYGNSNTETRERQAKGPPAKFKVALTVRFQAYTGIALRAELS